MTTFKRIAPTTRGSFTLLRWIKEHPILAMVALVYLLAWPKLITTATDSYGLTHFNLSPWFDIPTGWAPAIAAFTITALVQGKQSVQALWRAMWRWRVGWYWYALVLLGSAAIIFAEGGFYALATGSGHTLPITQMPLLQATGSFALMLVLYTLVNTEEVAWRGFALPRLQSRYGAIGGSLLLWVPWTLFHLPYFFTKGSMLQEMGFVTFASGTLALTLLFTWLFNQSGGNVLICTLLHAALNSWPPLLMPTPNRMPSFWGYATDAVIILCLVLILRKFEDLTTESAAA